MNKVYLIGNLTRDPEMRSTSAGIPVCNFSIAVNRRFKNAQTGQQETDFFNIVAWRQLAELCSSKGHHTTTTPVSIVYSRSTRPAPMAMLAAMSKASIMRMVPER